jgi:hypothetical protein
MARAFARFVIVKSRWGEHYKSMVVLSNEAALRAEAVSVETALRVDAAKSVYKSDAIMARKG